LETVRDFHPHVAIYLNLTPDHLDRHGSLEEYGKIKARIFKNQTNADTLIYNGQDMLVTGLSRFAKGHTIPFGVKCETGDCAYVKDGMLTISLDGVTYPLVHENEMALPGPHNVQNALAAALAAKCMDASTQAIQDALREYTGLHHRMEFVRKVNGVTYINDSKATNVDSMWYALGSFNTPVVLIAGGRDKDSDFTVLRERIQEKTREVILIGEAAKKMDKEFKGAAKLHKVKSLEAAVKRAKKIAQEGDVVMLSPGCASFDMFKNFEDRGDQFKTMVMNLS
jgi:UDP-N-acetylmuramoylalanine--D-glutamate ligase